MKNARTNNAFAAITPPARIKLSDSIVGQIERLILDGTLKPGDTLPPEREFAPSLGVSRPSLREAILKLEARGLIQARRNAGYAIADVAAPTLTDPLVHLLQQHPPAAYDILELRGSLDELAAGLAAARATDEDRERIKKCFGELIKADRKRGDQLKPTDSDLAFHLAVVDASHNLVLMHVMRGLYNLLHSSTYRFRNRIQTLPGGEKKLHDQHRAIYDAVVRGKPDAARLSARRHIAFLEATLREAPSGE
jgi:GntR family transcriptional repressor for pyruvate dehydrogenase complex